MKRIFIPATFILILILAAPAASQARVPRGKRPRVLIIGDSISMGYTPYVQRIFRGTAVVRHHRGNAGPTARGLEDIEKWLGRKKWAAIHFNWGLWDMYGWKHEGHDQTPETYERNLDTLVARLKQTGAVLIWATTTPACPEAEEESGLIIGPKGEAEYLDAAARVMKKHGVQINDLHALIKPVQPKYARGENDVHYTKDGYKLMAGQVADSIRKALNLSGPSAE